MDAKNETIGESVIFRHALAVRITHWVNVLCLLILMMSGLQIFNAHTRLYFGHSSEPQNAVLDMRAAQKADGAPVGLTTIGSTTFDTTGVFGLSGNAYGELEARGFPSWITLPSYRDLATGRRWHFFFAWAFVLNGLAYLVYSLWSGHVRRDLVPSRPQLRNIGHDIAEHIRLQISERRRGEALQRSSEARVSRGHFRAATACRAGGADDVAWDRRGVSVPCGRVRRPPVGPHDPFSLRDRYRAVRHRACRNGAGVRRLEQHALDDYRALSHRTRGVGR